MQWEFNVLYSAPVFTSPILEGPEFRSYSIIRINDRWEVWQTVSGSNGPRMWSRHARVEDAFASAEAIAY